MKYGKLRFVIGGVSVEPIASCFAWQFLQSGKLISLPKSERFYENPLTEI